MLQLRDYQRAAIDELYAYWSAKAGSPLIVLPTGAGKSLVIATIIQELLTNYPDMRILNATHQKELIEGNFKELIHAWPFAPAGIYSAGVGRRDAHAQVIFGGVQTIANKTKHIGHIDLVMVDEAHLMPRKSETQYGQLLAGLRAINPDLKLIGLTATPFRLGEGLMTDPVERAVTSSEGVSSVEMVAPLFDDICYEKPVGEMIDEGFLCRPISKGMATSYDLSGVGKLGGDYKQNALQAAVDQSDINSAVVDEVMAYGNSETQPRHAWLLFCSGVEHAYHMRDEIRSRGVSCETVCGETPPAERARILEDFKAGRLRAVTNNSVMTTGVNVPRIDLIAFCRPTLSCGLYLQMAGRGLRLHPSKETCLFLDFAGVVRKHGPIDAVTPPGARTGTGDAPVKQCPQDEGGCGSLVHASARVCPDCGFEFPINEEPKISRQAEDVPILSKGGATWRAVTGRRFYFHEAKEAANPPSVKVTYMCGMTAISEWVCPQHMEHPNPKSRQYPTSKAHRWWIQHGGQRPFPKSVMEWLERQSELLETAEISVEPQGRYWQVKAHKPGTERTVADNDNRPAANDNRGGMSEAAWREAMDEVPF